MNKYDNLIEPLKRKYRMRYKEDISTEELIYASLLFLDGELTRYNSDKRTKYLSKVKRKV